MSIEITSLYLLTGTLVSWLTYFINVKWKQGPVRASGLVTTIIAGSIYLLDMYIDLPEWMDKIPLIAIGASFVGMVSPQKMNTYFGVIIGGLVFTIVYLNSSQYFSKSGGALGTAACISLLLVYSIPLFRSKLKLFRFLVKLKSKRK